MKNIHQNREISALSFNERVLQEAEDKRNPIMERLRFLGIFSSNMDEFFKVRVASVQRRIELGKAKMAEVIELIGEHTRELDARFQRAYAEITEALAKEGVKLVTDVEVEQQSADVVAWLKEYFRREVLPTLVPIIINENLKFPRLTDGALYFAVRMWGERTPYAVLEIPSTLARFVELPNGNIMYIDDVIRHMLNEVFYIFEYDRVEAFAFKISRDAELDIDNDFSEGFIRKVERVLEQRKGGRPTRFVYDQAIPPSFRKLLLEALKITGDDTVIGGGRYHNMKDLMTFPNHRVGLTYPGVEPAPHPVLDRHSGPMSQAIREQDVLVTYPYQSFDHVLRLLREAAIDPEVEEIKLTLYRVAESSQIVNALINAARNGKSVFVVVELMARFDEQRNINSAERLTEVGATVVYGLPPIKVHGKLIHIQASDYSIAAFSTGNFNETTGRLYVDSTLMTADERLCGDAENMFEFLSKASLTRVMSTPKLKHLVVSPFSSRKQFSKFLAQEAEKGDEGYLLIKANHLTDAKMTRRILEAADAGVKMNFIVRTTYCVPAHPNIRAISILDRYLEHQRIYIFGKGEDRKIFLGSADLMERNLDWRVEVAFPIYAPELKAEIEAILQLQLDDNFKARVLDEAQSNQYVETNGIERRSQLATQQYYDAAFAGVSEAQESRVVGK